MKQQLSINWKGKNCIARFSRYIPGYPGSFNPYDGGYPPEGCEFEDLEIFVDGVDISESLTEEEYESFCWELDEFIQSETEEEADHGNR